MAESYLAEVEHDVRWTGTRVDVVLGSTSLPPDGHPGISADPYACRGPLADLYQRTGPLSDVRS